VRRGLAAACRVDPPSSRRRGNGAFAALGAEGKESCHVCAGQSRQEEVGEEEKRSSATRTSPTPRGVRPREAQSLLAVG